MVSIILYVDNKIGCIYFSLVRDVCFSIRNKYYYYYVLLYDYNYLIPINFITRSKEIG